MVEVVSGDLVVSLLVLFSFWFFLQKDIQLFVFTFCLQGAADPIAEHVAVIMIIVVTILVISVIKDTIITILEDLVVIPAEVVTSEVVIVTSEVVTAITEIVTVEVDTQIAIHVPVHIQALVEDLATNAITLVDGKFIFTFISIESLFLFNL